MERRKEGKKEGREGGKEGGNIKTKKGRTERERGKA
jgi:hypothetical protein